MKKTDNTKLEVATEPENQQPSFAEWVTPTRMALQQVPASEAEITGKVDMSAPVDILAQAKKTYLPARAYPFDFVSIARIRSVNVMPVCLFCSSKGMKANSYAPDEPHVTKKDMAIDIVFEFINSIAYGFYNGPSGLKIVPIATDQSPFGLLTYERHNCLGRLTQSNLYDKFSTVTFDGDLSILPTWYVFKDDKTQLTKNVDIVVALLIVDGMPDDFTAFCATLSMMPSHIRILVLLLNNGKGKNAAVRRFKSLREQFPDHVRLIVVNAKMSPKRVAMILLELMGLRWN